MLPRNIATDADAAEAMASYGIERVPVDYFHWEGFRYSTLKDAIAAAKRGGRASAAGAAGA
jgi:hypothetical protein